MPAYYQLTALEKELLELGADMDPGERDDYQERKAKDPVDWRTYYQVGEPVRVQE